MQAQDSDHQERSSRESGPEPTLANEIDGTQSNHDIVTLRFDRPDDTGNQAVTGVLPGKAASRNGFRGYCRCIADTFRSGEYQTRRDAYLTTHPLSNLRLYIVLKSDRRRQSTSPGDSASRKQAPISLDMGEITRS